MNGNWKKEEIQLRLFKIVCWGIYMDPGGMKFQGNRGDCTVRTFVICTPCQMLFWWSYQEEQVCWYVTWMGEWHIVVCGEETWGNEQLESPRYWWDDNIKWNCKKWLEFGLGWYFFGWRIVSGCCENHSESLGCMKCVKLLD